MRRAQLPAFWTRQVSTTNTTTMASLTTGYADAANSVTATHSGKIVYTPGDALHTGKQSACNAERFAITYTNDAGPGTNLP